MLTPNSYQISLRDPNGVKLIASINRYSSFEYTRTVNNIGACELVMAYEDRGDAVETWSKFKPDGRIVIERSINGAPLYVDGLYFIRRRKRNKSADGLWTMTFIGEDPISLLNRRTTNVNEKNATVNIKVADYADDVLKDLFKNYLGTSAGGGLQPIRLHHATN